MKKQYLSAVDIVLLRKRAIVELVNDELYKMCRMEQTRHRSMKGFLVISVTA